MKRLLGLAATLCLVTAGCSGSGPDALMKRQIALMNDAADALESGDTSKAQALEAEGKELQAKMKELNLSADEMKALGEKYKPELEKAMMRMMSAAFKGMGDKMGNPFGKQ